MGKKIRIILIIDDSPEDRHMYRRHLGHDPTTEYQFVEVDKGVEAVRLGMSVHIDCVLLDYHLPDIDGLEVLDQLRRHIGLDVPVIMLTGQGDESVAVQAMKHGACDYIVKSRLTPESLCETVHNALESVVSTGTTQLSPSEPSSSPSSSSLELPRLIAGRFQVQGQAKRGGMGTVFEAVDLHTLVRVAVKVMARSNAGAQLRFMREARVLAELHHPAIVRYVDHGCTPEGDPFLVMDWLEGDDLAAYLRFHPKLSAREAALMGMRVSEALTVAHARGLVHRDIKPSNLFLPDGDIERVTLVDFGIVRDAHGDSMLTLTGKTMGTPGFMAPEQVRGDRDIDHRADLFSLGCVLFQCITGTRYFEGNSVLSVLAKITDNRYDRRPRLYHEPIPRALADLVAQMLTRERGERPQSASEVARRLGDLLAG